MNKSQMEMLSAKSAVERVVNALVAAHQKSESKSREVLHQQIDEVLHAFVASRQLKAFRFNGTPRVDTLEVWIQDHNNNGCNLTFILPEFEPIDWNAILTKETNPIKTIRELIEEQNQVRAEVETVSWPFPTRAAEPPEDPVKIGRPSTQAPSRIVSRKPNLNFIRNRVDLQEAASQEDPMDTYDRVKKSFS